MWTSSLLVSVLFDLNLQQRTILCASVLASVFVFVRALKTFFFPARQVDEHGNSIPPGPFGLPILGSFPFLTHFPELTLDYWAKRFGPLYSLWLGNQLFVIVSDPQIVKDLMVTNGALFSSRKEMFLKSQIIFAGRGITATPYNDRWRKHRRLSTIALSARAVDGYTHVLDYEATVLIKDLMKYGKAGAAPINPQPHAGRCSLNNMLTVAFGTRTDSIDHPLVAKALRLSREFMNCTGPVSNMTDFVPLLQYLPFNPMIKRGKALHHGLVETYGGMVNDIDARMNRGEKVQDCLVKTLLESKDKEDLDHLDMAILCSAFMIGGVETTASIMQWFSALIPAYPEIQQKAQEELDRVVGRDRMPTVEDEKNLPYIHAIIKEVERCHNPFWLGTPHVNTEDFTYRGQFIPKDTVLVLNTYTMHHDAQRHPEPFRFNPDRYIQDSTLSSESANLPNPYERDHWMFGVGRRICPGMWVAEREIFLVIARVLWAFRMEEIPGEPIDLKEYDGLSGRSPVPFRIKMIPRHDKVMEVLDKA
ncbi:hypothetical protein GYMLUDRAFT_50453 [Collybiopsis luxurians FD-317 M1]|uniref:Unplaced genomic scaffold GYMLUscaffold_111, whole genome shotgun sequence n=1 Tax=Collybiopsis luxurians FD-317 M1 TaxID=944289 RepID=A0A0D0AN32_9AGAR|nr:hypothetical protein GYMLUDRAFT_50453 [Collybiopsis luxurians FD-317 M1]